MRKYHLPLAALTVLAAFIPTVLNAQEYEGFPAERIRLQRPNPDESAHYVPDTLYTQNRIVLQQVKLVQSGATGMQIVGRVVTDFDANKVPPNEVGKIPSGQLKDIKVNIGLYHVESVLDRRSDGSVKPPKIDPKSPGILVPEQSMTVTIDQTFGPFGRADFKLPAMSKPLAPGLYQLIAKVNFRVQDSGIRKALKYASDWYGYETEYEVDENGDYVFDANNELIPIYKRIFGTDEPHEKWYNELINNIGEVSDVAQLWIGATLRDGKYELVTPKQGTDRKPANHMLWTLHQEIIFQVMKLKHEYDNADTLAAEELETYKNLDFGRLPADKVQQMIADKEAELEKNVQRIRRDNPEMIKMLGGEASEQEKAIHLSATAAKTSLLDQMIRFQEYLIKRYWVFVDGYVMYRGYHSINVPAFRAYDAVQKNDVEAVSRKRKEDLLAARNADGGLQKRWEDRREAWKYYPTEATKLVFDYLRTKEEKDVWDPENFTMEDEDAEGNKVLLLDVVAWTNHRLEFLPEYIEETDKILAQVTTTNVYANQIWPQALAEATAARDAVISLSYAWEHYIRTKFMNEDSKDVVKAWQKLADDNPSLKLNTYLNGANVSAGTIESRIKGYIANVKSSINLPDFVYRHNRAIDAGATGDDLPGSRPPSAPTKD